MPSETTVDKPYWHIHHKLILEFATEPIENRIEYIRESKPRSEIALRLKLLKPVKGKLPAALHKAEAVLDKVLVAYDKAWVVLDKAWADVDKARVAYDKAWTAYSKAWAAYNKAGEAYDKAREAYNKAEAAYDKAIADNLPAIMALHDKECPNCPWDGKTIFPEEHTNG